MSFGDSATSGPGLDVVVWIPVENVTCLALAYRDNNSVVVVISNTGSIILVRGWM